MSEQSNSYTPPMIEPGARRVTKDWRVQCGFSVFTMPAGSTVEVESIDRNYHKAIVRFGERDSDWIHIGTLRDHTEPLPASAEQQPAEAGRHTPGPLRLCHHLQSPEKDKSCTCGYRGGIWGGDGEHIVCEMGGTHVPGEEGFEPARYSRDVEIATAHLLAAAYTSYDKAFGPRAVEAAEADLLGEAVEAIKGLLSMAEYGGPVRVEPGHHCGDPDSNCDMTCMDARRDADLMQSARAILAKLDKRGGE